MRRNCWRSFLLVLVLTLGVRGIAQQPQTATAPSSQSDISTIQQLEQQWINADRLPQAQRVQFFEGVLDPDGLHILHSGKSYFNREILDYYRSHPEAPKAADAPHAQIAGMQVRFYGDVAIVNGATQVPDQKGDTHLVRFTDVFQKRGGKWVAINEQETDVIGTELGAQQ